MAAVVADARGIVVIRDAVVVDVTDDSHVHARDGGVVVEGSVAPIAAFIAVAVVAVPVVHATIEADVRAPVAVVPAITAAIVAPVARSPE
jgi:hypothetical protein